MTENHSNYLSPESVFFSWKEATAGNFYSKTEWKRRGYEVNNFVPDGILVLKTARVSVPLWRPVLGVDGDFLVVAEDWFDLYSEGLVLGGKLSSLNSSVSDFSTSKENGSKSESDSLADSSVYSISSLKNERKGRREGRTGTIRSEGFEKISQTSSEQRISEVNNFAKPRERRNENHPCWIPKDYPIDEVPEDIKESLLKLSNLVYLYSQSQPNPDDFVPLKKRYLENQFGEKNTNRILKLAIESGLLETDNFYEIGQKAKGYRFTDIYRNQPHRIINTLRTKKEQAHSDKQMGHRDHKHIRYLWEHLTRLTVNNAKLEAYRGIWEIYEPCQTILNGHFYLTQDDFGGRWYSNLTNLKKEARGLLRVEGKSESLWEIDIKNSQPLFASLAAQKAGFHDEGFSILCHEGRLYEALATLWGMSREDAKEELLRIFYSKNGYRSKEKTIFENQFLTFSDFMKKSKKLNHVRFANLMQTTERKFIVDTVVPELIRQAGGIFVATIHDSLIVEKRRAEFAHDVLAGLFMARFGVKPMTHLKDTGEYLS